MVGRGPRSAIERAESGNSRPTVVRACALLDRLASRIAPHRYSDTRDIARAQEPSSFSLLPQERGCLCPYDIRGSTELKHHQPFFIFCPARPLLNPPHAQYLLSLNEKGWKSPADRACCPARWWHNRHTRPLCFRCGGRHMSVWDREHRAGCRRWRISFACGPPCACLEASYCGGSICSYTACRTMVVQRSQRVSQQF